MSQVTLLLTPACLVRISMHLCDYRRRIYLPRLRLRPHLLHLLYLCLHLAPCLHKHTPHPYPHPHPRPCLPLHLHPHLHLLLLS